MDSQDPEIAILKRTILNLDRELSRTKAAKDGAYSERNKLVAAMTKLFPSSLERHDGVEWEDDWRWVVFLDFPTGQASWHLHDSELPQFSHLEKEVGRKWDGHTNDEKYARLAALSSSPAALEFKKQHCSVCDPGPCDHFAAAGKDAV